MFFYKSGKVFACFLSFMASGANRTLCADVFDAPPQISKMEGQVMTTGVSLRIICVATFFLYLTPFWPAFAQDAPTSRCITCHTNVKKLIRLGWEVEKVRGKPRVSAETEGEG